MYHIRTVLSFIDGLLVRNGMKSLRFKIPYRGKGRFNDVGVLAKKSLSCLVGVPELPCNLDYGGVIGCGKSRSFRKSIGFRVKEENAHGVRCLTRELGSSILSRLNIRCKDHKLSHLLELDLTLDL